MLSSDDAAAVCSEDCRRFEIRATHPLELELRLDLFSEALGARGGRVLRVLRSQGPEGSLLASVGYWLRLPGASPELPASALLEQMELVPE